MIRDQRSLPGGTSNERQREAWRKERKDNSQARVDNAGGGGGKKKIIYFQSVEKMQILGKPY